MARRESKRPQVRAAGGLVWRTALLADASGATRTGVEVVVIHRPRYDDWSFPKGKLDRGESFEAAAVREVEEETGMVCELGDELAPARYVDAKGRVKLVRYWDMRVVDVRPWRPNREVDRRRWLPLGEAAEVLTYAHDRAVLDAFARDLERGAAG